MYRAVPWGKMRTRKNPHDIFNHRVRAAASRLSLYEAVSKLCNAFGLQSLPPRAVALCRELKAEERTILNRLRTEHIPLCMLAVMQAKEMKQEAIARAKSPLFNIVEGEGNREGAQS